MRTIYQRFFLTFFVLLAAHGALAQQRSRVINQPDNSGTAVTTPQAQPVLPAVKTKYEGGIYGYRRKINGTLTFDDTKRQIVFRDQHQQPTFALPYESISEAHGDTQSRRPAAATVASSVPVYYFPYSVLPALSGLIKKKYRYLIIQCTDPHTSGATTVSFKIGNKDTLNSVLASLANRAGLTPLGDIYIRK